MHERPIGDLVDALRPLGARIGYLQREGFPPLLIEAASARTQQPVRVRGAASSQFLTGILQSAPLLARAHDLIIEVEGELISRPYIDLSLALMRRFGVDVECAPTSAGAPRYAIAAGACYRSPGTFAVEGDASSASYFLALGALAGGPVRVHGMGRNSLQGDVRFAEVLTMMGAEVTQGADWTEARSPGLIGGFRPRAIDADFNHIPDAAMTAAVVALFADGPSVLRNIGSWRVKETDRLQAMATELAKFGAEVEAGPDFLRIVPPASLRPAAVDTYDDHRMAMSFSLAACGNVAVRINEPGCVSKTFPDYFARLAVLTGR